MLREYDFCLTELSRWWVIFWDVPRVPLSGLTSLKRHTWQRRSTCLSSWSAWRWVLCCRQPAFHRNEPTALSEAEVQRLWPYYGWHFTKNFLVVFHIATGRHCLRPSHSVTQASSTRNRDLLEKPMHDPRSGPRLVCLAFPVADARWRRKATATQGPHLQTLEPRP